MGREFRAAPLLFRHSVIAQLAQNIYCSAIRVQSATPAFDSSNLQLNAGMFRLQMKPKRG